MGDCWISVAHSVDRNHLKAYTKEESRKQDRQTD